MGQAIKGQWKSRSTLNFNGVIVSNHHQNNKQFFFRSQLFRSKAATRAPLPMAAILYFSCARAHRILVVVFGSNMNSVAGTCCITVHTNGHGILATFCPRDVSHEVQQVELRATCREDKMSPKLVLHNYDSISSHEGTYRCNMSLRYVPATFSCVCKRYDFLPATCPRYTSQLYVPSVCTIQIFVAALCRCDMSLPHDPSCLPTLIPPFS